MGFLVTALEVTGTGKDNGIIVSLCGTGFHVTAVTAIEETMLAGNGHNNAPTPYFVSGPGGAVVNIRVYGEGSARYLRTDADATTANNLDDLPGC